jgi:hypothetical protein
MGGSECPSRCGLPYSTPESFTLGYNSRFKCLHVADSRESQYGMCLDLWFEETLLASRTHRFHMLKEMYLRYGWSPDANAGELNCILQDTRSIYPLMAFGLWHAWKTSWSRIVVRRQQCLDLVWKWTGEPSPGWSKTHLTVRTLVGLSQLTCTIARQLISAVGIEVLSN